MVRRRVEILAALPRSHGLHLAAGHGITGMLEIAFWGDPSTNLSLISK
jgi:hypothetical protein